MPRAKVRKASGPGTWKYVVGRRPHTVTAFERGDKSNIVWLRWTRPRTGGIYEKMSLAFGVRDDRGRLDTAKVQVAQDRANKAYDRLRGGQNPREPAQVVDDDGAAKLTLARGLELALAVPDGMYAVENEHVRDMRRYQRYLLQALPSTMTWEELSEVSYETCWRKLAVLKRDKEVGGMRTCELVIVLLAQTGRWLKRARHLKDAPAAPEEGYLAKLRADWRRITGEARTATARPRYTTEELGRLHLHVDDNRADPRIRLAFRLAGEARLGQALRRCGREHLDLREVGAFRAGRFVIPDSGKKKGTQVDLTPAMRAAVLHELTAGYLRDLEAAYQARLLSTYSLFPGGRLVGGVARSNGIRPLGDRAASDLWHEFEHVAGVDVVQHRGWYGARRTGADLAEDVETDGRALNAITGHTSDDMRRRIYQEKARDAVLAKAATAREAARQLAIDAARSMSSTAGADTGAPSNWEQRRAAKRERRAAAHERQRAREGRRQATFPPKPCKRCGVEFTPTGPNTRACVACSPRRQRLSSARAS